MPIKITLRNARSDFDKLCERVANDGRVVIITRQGKTSVALMSARELSGLIETSYLLKSSRNAHRLLAALRRAKSAH